KPPNVRSAPAEPWRSSGLARAISLGLELQVFERRGVGEAGYKVGAALFHAGADAPDEGQLVDGHERRVVGEQLLHLVHEGLALLGVDLAGLARIEIVDLRQ